MVSYAESSEDDEPVPILNRRRTRTRQVVDDEDDYGDDGSADVPEDDGACPVAIISTFHVSNLAMQTISTILLFRTNPTVILLDLRRERGHHNRLLPENDPMCRPPQ